MKARVRWEQLCAVDDFETILLGLRRSSTSRVLETRSELPARFDHLREFPEMGLLTDVRGPACAHTGGS